MSVRKIGPYGVFPIGYGCMEVGGRYGPIGWGEAVRLLQATIGAGVTLFDTSDRYGAGRSEELLAAAIGKRRDQVQLCTKFGHILGPNGEVVREDGRPEYVVEACEASLRRLGVDYIDLYLQHRVDKSVPIEETVGAMAGLVEAGKVGAIGLCEVRPNTLRRASTVHPIAVVQSEYSLWYRGVESELLPTCRELGVAFIAYAPLGRGLLTGSITNVLPETDRRGQHPRFQGDNLIRNLRIVADLRELARDYGCTVSQLCLAWLLCKHDDVVPIPGTTSIGHMQENVAALKFTLSAMDIDRLDHLVPVGAGAGERYPAASMSSVDL